ncbi:MAG: 4-hydroxy-3-methylbut-2-enyl diphosphate reductase [Chitinophagaceae bacterium]|nr:4-hydroxy-3-methylbut-2-enyl diphosphate reductase [Chitinophagaceae bacterium]
MKSFNVPTHYRSPLVSAIKNKRKADDKLKKDFTPTLLEVGSLQIILARHFGFCYGVENAIEIAFKAIDENPGKRIFLLSEMIHNPNVNADLVARGVKFIMDTSGRMLMNWDELSSEDIVIIPAFGTTVEMEALLRNKGIEPATYETTCPFVEKVWNRAEKIGKEGYTIIVHGKPKHEETRATFSHSNVHTPTVVVKDMKEAEILASFINGERPAAEFYGQFKGQYSEGFDVSKDLQRIGVVNQTTMLASETQSIADFLKRAILAHYPVEPGRETERFAETRDTLCYATNDNQSAVQGMLQEEADLAIVIGGYNSSNTSHLVELCEEKLPTYFIKDEYCLINEKLISHYDWRQHTEEMTTDFLPAKDKVRIMITSGASCPDALVERIIERLADLSGNTAAMRQLQQEW